MSATSDSKQKRAVIRAAQAPSEDQLWAFERFLTKKYGPCTLTFQEDPSLKSGFVLEIGHDVYDWSLSGRLYQMREMIEELPQVPSDRLMPLIRENVAKWRPAVVPQEVGTVMTVGDGIALVQGLTNATYGEIVVFECGMKGMVQDLKRDQIGCILFGDDQDVLEGSKVYRTKREAGIPVGDQFLGRVIDALGSPIEGKGTIQATDYRPVESPAPGIIDRQPVDRPMETGILSIDSMFPIGRGQRELIIGDRQTGKTTIALDTILNQKGKDVVCIYVAIGQKNSSVMQLTQTLRNAGAMDYTIVIDASASDAVPLQYIAPYAGCAMGEYFMDKGRDVLIVYDDLSKHAVAYRAMSLLLERSPGREAYPGDVFYLHSRLLERAAHLSDEKGGGSMTALPIVETQAGDVSAYIPTNIISITDGQIFLESDLFFEGQRPAVNVGLSVSRVGGAAQTKAMKKAAGSIKLDLSQYREMEVFTQFSSDLDETTKQQLAYGQGLMRLLRQNQHHPYQQHEQVILLTCALAHQFLGIDVKKVGEAAQALLAYFAREKADLCKTIDTTGQLSDEARQEITDSAEEVLAAFRKK